MSKYVPQRMLKICEDQVKPAKVKAGGMRGANVSCGGRWWEEGEERRPIRNIEDKKGKYASRKSQGDGLYISISISIYQYLHIEFLCIIQSVIKVKPTYQIVCRNLRQILSSNCEVRFSPPSPYYHHMIH